MLGDLSKKFESNGNPGAISNGWGDAGGKSYGMYQLASNTGSVHNYLGWAKQKGYWFANDLLTYDVGSVGFDNLWYWLGKSANREDFIKSQHDYIMEKYYVPAVEALKEAGYDVEGKLSVTMADVVWSRAVQYGPYQIVEMFTIACQSLGYPNLSYVNDKYFDEEMIKAIYLDVCSTDDWTNGSPSLRDGLFSRFKWECAMALDQLKKESADV